MKLPESSVNILQVYNWTITSTWVFLITRNQAMGWLSDPRLIKNGYSPSHAMGMMYQRNADTSDGLHKSGSYFVVVYVDMRITAVHNDVKLNGHDYTQLMLGDLLLVNNDHLEYLVELGLQAE